jgi:hypothetical protein
MRRRFLNLKKPWDSPETSPGCGRTFSEKEGQEAAMRLLPPLHVVLAAIVTCVATPAYAQWARHHGSECVPQIPPSLAQFAVVMGGATNADPGFGTDMVCAFDDSDASPAGTLTEVSIYLYDASPTDSIIVNVCATLPTDQGGGTCSGSRRTTDSFVGPGVLTFSGSELDAWRRDGNFGYLQIWVPAKSGTRLSFIKGWITQQ